MRRFPVRMLMMTVAAALLAACDGSPTGPAAAGLLEITPDQPSYAAGSVVSLTLRNPSRQTVTYAVCNAYRLERRLSGMWVPAPREASFELCAFSHGAVQPGQSTTEHARLMDDQAPGTYRVVFVDVAAPGAAGRDEPSQPFEVTR